MLETPLYFILLGLCPGLCFSIFYLKGIKEYSRNDNLKLLSFHSFFAVIFLVIFLIFCMLSSILINSIPYFSKHIGSINTEFSIICCLFLYLSSFYVAFKSGKFLCKEKFGYDSIKPTCHWNSVFEKKGDDKNFFITMVVETGGNSWLYVGMLDDYLTNNSELEYIQIKAAYRRTIENDETPLKKKKGFQQRFYKINADYLIIKYKDVRSLGVRIITIKQKTPISNK